MGELRPPAEPRRHLLTIADLSRRDVERILETARGMASSLDREMKKLPTLRGRTVVNLFYESSTRTLASFELAAKRLSADTMSLRASGSSVDKGESLTDTARTLSAYDPDVIVVRHPSIGAAALVARCTEASVVNAGDGKHQHPTQALLDLYAMETRLGHLDGLHVAIVGDVLHSRVARSLVQALALVEARSTLIGPPTLVPRVLETLGCSVSNDIRDLAEADVVYVLRMQQERMAPGEAFIPVAPRVHGALRDHAGAGAFRSGRHAPRADESWRRDRRARRRLASRARHRPGACGSRRAHGGPLRRLDTGAHPRTGNGRGRVVLFSRNGRSDSLVLEGRVLAPAQGIDECLRITVTDGVISAIEPAAASALVIAPAFVDPHVHLRTPGREDEETLRSGTEAAAAGGYCAILAMPNTEPVVDSSAVLGALIERARVDAVVPTGFMAAISKGQDGKELSEMADLASAGAAAFTDDGKPVVSAGLMRRALQYSALAGRPLALHCEEPALSRGGHVHEGEVSAEIGLGPYPSTAESVMVERDLALAAAEERPLHLMHLSARESVARPAAGERGGRRRDRRGDAAPPLPDGRGGALARPEPQDEPAAPLRGRPRSHSLEALRDGTIGAVATDHAPHARHEKDVPFEDAPFGVTGLETSFAALHTYLVLPGELDLETLLERMSSGPARALGLAEPRIETGARANLVALDLDAEWEVTEDGFRSLSANSWLLGKTLRGRVVRTVADGREVFVA